MAYKLGDIFIGKFAITQYFGARPEVYYNRYKLKGHNGLDFGCPSMTPLLAAADGKVSEAGFDAGGYGNYVKIVHDGYLTLYAHMNDILVHVGDKVITGQLIGHSNNTGFSDAPHLHFGVAPCDANGIKTEVGNGFSGYIDPLNSRCVWDLKYPTVPKVPGLKDKPDVPVPAEQFTDLVTKSTQWDIIAAYFHLSEIERIDPKGGEKIVQRFAELQKGYDDRGKEIEELQKMVPTTPPAPTPDTPPVGGPTPPDEKPLTEEEKNILFQDLNTVFAKILKVLFRK